jgi:hypothetical protein
MPPELPPYIDLDGSLIFQPPYVQKDAMLFGWFVRADRTRLQALLDRTFNGICRGQVEYRVLASLVILSFANIAEVGSYQPPDSQLGHTTEGDVVFWIPVGAYVGGQLQRVVWHMGYIWVNNPVAVSIGREVHGFPKAIARMTLPKTPDDRGPFWAESMVLLRHAPEANMSWQRLLDIERDPIAVRESHAEWTAAGQGLRELLEGLIAFDLDRFDGQSLESLFGDLLGGALPILFLKQFRDATTTDRACYQAVIEANATVRQFMAAGPLPLGWRLRLYEYASIHIARTLGIVPEQVVGPGFWTRFTFSMDLGRIIVDVTAGSR